MGGRRSVARRRPLVASHRGAACGRPGAAGPPPSPEQPYDPRVPDRRARVPLHPRRGVRGAGRALRDRPRGRAAGGRRVRVARGGAGAVAGGVGRGERPRPALARAPRRHPADAPQPRHRRTAAGPCTATRRCPTGRRRSASRSCSSRRSGPPTSRSTCAAATASSSSSSGWAAPSTSSPTTRVLARPPPRPRVVDRRGGPGRRRPGVRGGGHGRPGAVPRPPRGLEPRRSLRAAHRGRPRRAADRVGHRVRRPRGRRGGADRGPVPLDRRVHRRPRSSRPPTGCSAGFRRPRCARRSSSSASTGTSPSR